MRVQGADELAFGTQRQVPDEPHQDQGRVVTRQELGPQGVGEFGRQLRLTELGRHGSHAIGYEDLPEGPRVGL